MTCNEEKPRRKEPSPYQITFAGVISVAGLLASGVATYNALQNDIATLKRDVMYQERTNERLSNEIHNARLEQRETMREFNEKLDRIIENWSQRRR
jgi:cell division protein FtsB